MGCFYQISHEVPLKVGEMVLSQSKSLTTPEIAQPSPAYADSSRGLNTQGGARGNAEAWASGMLEGGGSCFSSGYCPWSGCRETGRWSSTVILVAAPPRLSPKPPTPASPHASPPPQPRECL